MALFAQLGDDSSRTPSSAVSLGRMEAGVTSRIVGGIAGRNGRNGLRNMLQIQCLKMVAGARSHLYRTEARLPAVRRRRGNA